METRNLTCIGCPMGCPLTVKIENGTVLSVEGNTCKRGAIYGKKEVLLKIMNMEYLQMKYIKSGQE